MQNSFVYNPGPTNITIIQQVNVKNVHPVYGAGIRTHDLWDMSHLQTPLDLGLVL